MSRNRVWVLVALVCALVGVPTRAYASDGFLGGLEDLTGTREVDVGQDYEREFLESYEPELVTETPQSRDGEVPLTLQQQIEQTVRNGMTITFDERDWVPGAYYYGAFRAVLLIVVPVAVLLVFMWWGVRKSKNVVMRAFRKGKASI